jgi:signal transduction histidine kinase
VEVDFQKGNFLILILQDLLHNAIESSSAGKPVRLCAEHLGTGLQIIVEDEGPGIPFDRQETLFHPRNSLKKGGTGLGLVLCSQMAIHIGASVELLSSDQSGSRFCVRLPLETSPENP